MRKHLFSILSSLVLVACTVLSLLFTFVFEKSYGKFVSIEANDDLLSSGDFTDNSFSYTNSSDFIEVNLQQIIRFETTVYVVDIKISNLKFLKTAFAKDEFGLNIKEHTSVIAKRKKAIVAINGDYYGFREKGYVIRNGVVYGENREPRDSTSEILLIDKNGEFSIMKEIDTSVSLLKDNAWQVFCFGPGIISNNEIVVDEKTEVGGHKSSNPRTAIGIIEPLHYIFMTSDGRSDESKGLTLYQLGMVLQEFKVKTAYNLDGGGSTTLYFKGKVINKPITNYNKIQERSISDIVYIG